MIRAALLVCSTAAVHINCTVAVPRRIRAGDRVAARVDVAVAGATAESLVVELRAAGPVVFGPGAPGLDPPGDAGDDDVIYAVRGERRRRWLVRLGARRRRAVWALFAAERPDAVTLRARAALGDATATCEAPVSVVAAAPRATDCVAPVSAALDARALVVGEPTRLRAPALSRVPLPAGLTLVRGGRVDASGVVFVDGGGAADVVAAWPGLFRAPGGCADASAGLRVAVGTGRGADGRLRLGDVSWEYSSL
jgi:hypothetical protein